MKTGDRNNTRSRRERLYNSEYTREIFNPYNDTDYCTYCGDIATCVDHTLSLHARDLGKGGEQYLVPCCNTCNSRAGRKYFPNFYAKFLFLHKQYLVEFQSISIWTEDEIQELGKNMQMYIRDSMEYRLRLAEKIAYSKKLIKNAERKFYKEM